MNWRALAAAAALTAAPQAPVAQTAAEPASFAGTWDLFWRTRQGGTQQQGYLVVTQDGSRLAAQVHGKGSLKAMGTAEGRVFALHGRKMGAPFTIGGRLEDDRLHGSVKVLSVERRFVGVRRN